MILFHVTCITKFIYANFNFCQFLPVFATVLANIPFCQNDQPCNQNKAILYFESAVNIKNSQEFSRTLFAKILLLSIYININQNNAK